MALIGITKFDTEPFVSRRDPAFKQVDVLVDPDDPKSGTYKEDSWDDSASVFQISPLDVFTTARIYDSGSKLVQGTDGSEASIATFVNQTNIEACRFGLRGWSNFLDEGGKPIPFTTEEVSIGGRKYEVASDASLKALGVHLVAEIGAKIKSISEVAQTTRKK